MALVAQPERRPLAKEPLVATWTRVAGGLMHARTGARVPAGDPPVVVLVHGMVISSSYMVPLAELLAPLCKVFAPDLPGYGKSYKPWPILTLPELADALAAWMEAARLPRADVFGNSFGCQIVAEFAVRHPARVRRLVLQGPTTDPDARTKWRQFRRLMRNGRHEPAVLAWISLKDYAAAGLRRAWATFDLVVRDRIETKLPRVQAPTLVVRGDLDPLVPQSWAERVTNLLPRGELVVMPGAPHTINFTAPEDLVRVMRPFLGL